MGEIILTSALPVIGFHRVQLYGFALVREPHVEQFNKAWCYAKRTSQEWSFFLNPESLGRLPTLSFCSRRR